MAAEIFHREEDSVWRTRGNNERTKHTENECAKKIVGLVSGLAWLLWTSVGVENHTHDERMARRAAIAIGVVHLAVDGYEIPCMSLHGLGEFVRAVNGYKYQWQTPAPPPNTMHCRVSARRSSLHMIK